MVQFKERHKGPEELSSWWCRGRWGGAPGGGDPLGRPLVGTELSMLKEFTEGQGGQGRVKVAEQGAAVPGSTLHSQGTFSF